MPRLDLSYQISSTPHLTDLDADLHISFENNFAYYTTNEFNNNNSIIESSVNLRAFTTLHCNIRSLSANDDCFLQMLRDLYYPFSLFGLSETTFVNDKDNFLNTNINGYNFIHNHSLTNAGGVGFFIRNNLRVKIRKNLTKSAIHSEMLWIEITRSNESNLICGVIYRHPNGDLNDFMELLNSTIGKIHQENKLCLFMGDLNVDLLKTEIGPASENFINVLFSYLFSTFHSSTN